jgi:hypothetical protein
VISKLSLALPARFRIPQFAPRPHPNLAPPPATCVGLGTHPPQHHRFAVDFEPRSLDELHAVQDAVLQSGGELRGSFLIDTPVFATSQL